MIDRDSDPAVGQAVDRLVANHLERVTQQTEVSGLLQRVRQSRQIDEAIFTSAPLSDADGDSRIAQPAMTAQRHERLDRPSEQSRWTSSLTWAVLAGSVLLATFLGGRQLGPPAANASVMLRDLQSVHRGEVDRCYRIQYAPDPRFWDGTNQLEGPSHSVLWTRGDRFWSDCTIGDIRLLIGRQQDGTLWVSRSRSQAIRFTPEQSQLPQDVALLCAVNAMTVPRLVEEVLADFDLRADGSQTNPDSAGLLVWAALKPGRSHSLISSALLEIDPETQVLTRLVLWMKRDGRPRGTVTYTFLESGVQSDAQYQLQAHVDDDAMIENHTFEKVGDR